MKYANTILFFLVSFSVFVAVLNYALDMKERDECVRWSGQNVEYMAGWQFEQCRQRGVPLK